MDHDLRVPWVMSEESIDLIRLMLDRDVEKRITISMVLEHPWCKGIGGASPTTATASASGVGSGGAIVEADA